MKNYIVFFRILLFLRSTLLSNIFAKIQNMKFFTIGLWDYSETEYFNRLVDNNIEVFCDTRQNTDIKNEIYKFADTEELPYKLQELGIKYIHLSDLAPSKEIRNLQKTADIKAGITKEQRTELCSEFKNAYQREILDNFDLRKFINQLKGNKFKNIAIFCVEKNLNACHRSLIGLEIKRLGYTVEHIL